MTAPVIRYPAGQITPVGFWIISNDKRPSMKLKAYDGSIQFDILGGAAPPFNDPMLPEAVALKSMKGLIPPWRHIDQKGATQDGVSNIDNLYEPIETEMVVECIGRDPKHKHRVVRDLIASLDAKQQSPLEWRTGDLGLWWAPVRWFKGSPPDPLANLQRCRQTLSLRLRTDDAFWRADPDTQIFTGTTGFVVRTNPGDQPMYDDYVLFGPGTFTLYNGPTSSEFIKFGPLAANQIAYLRTDPRRRIVYDLSSFPANVSLPDANAFQKALADFISFATANNTNLLLSVIQSIFGVFGSAPAPTPPQGNFYGLLSGRFSDAAAIPAKSPGNPTTPYHVKVGISGGSGASKIIVSGLPLRRYPI